MGGKTRVREGRCGGSSLAVALGLLIGACQAVPQLPLLSPIAAGGNFGYSESPLGDDRYAVIYVAPERLSLAYPGGNQADASAVRTLAFDMAIWRAAQLAQAHGFQGFRVADRRSDVNSYPDPYDYYDDEPLFGGPVGPGWGWGGPYGYDFGAFPATPRNYLQATVTIDIVLEHALQPGDYEAADAIRQLRRTYPGADGLAPPPSGAAPQPGS